MSHPSANHAAFSDRVRVCGPVDVLHVFLREDLPQTHVSALSVVPLPDCFHRIRAKDLGDARRQSAALRANAGSSSCTIFVDVEATVDRDVRKALHAAERIGSTTASGEPAVRYVGTPHGLAGFIDDLHRLGIADGVTLRSAQFPACSEDSINEVLQALTA
ncbi:hypothetical protein [Mycobacterium sp. URHB0044]|jgi:alkanesulfonate monooxygenase SsuD/methylene tetrahydromethanopterin reductase-like flavin-dependent oxidoreductase (luciferase family)|uniref:hypothetical protein n=1 Tax=Mycobacterium sp. URHB0044 TaxID=1380386 RepID=UPI000688E8A5|nr:hypothetical protein [Mycobacterium sp. URHB0044]